MNPKTIKIKKGCLYKQRMSSQKIGIAHQEIEEVALFSLTIKRMQFQMEMPNKMINHKVYSLMT